MPYQVVTNDNGHHSTWPDHKELPAGWEPTGFLGSEEECAEHIAEVWDGPGPRSGRAPGAAATNVLTTDRIRLRELDPAQVAGLLEVLDGAATSDEYVGNYPLTGTGFGARNFLTRTPEELRFGFGMYLVSAQPDGLAFGDLGFHRPPKDGVAEIGFGLAESARGQGYATEAVAELTRWACTQSGVRRVVARTTADNAGAQGVLGRAGFRLERTEGDILHYAFRLAPDLPDSEPMRDDEEERAALAKLGKVRKAGGDDLAFKAGTDPLRRVVRDGKRLLAYAQSGDKEGVEDPSNHLMFIVVHPAVARRGLAERLLGEVRDHARAHGRTGMVTGTPDEDHPSVAWVRKHGFRPIGHHLITRRDKGAAAVDTPEGLVVDVVDRADAAAAEEFVRLATRTVAEAVMPGGARMTSDPDEIRRDLIEEHTGALLVCRAPDRALGWLALSPLADGEEAFVLAAQVLAEAAGRGVPAALLAAAAGLADEAGAASVTAVAEEEGQRELAETLPGCGFAPVAGRTIWFADVEPTR
ncbi:GNAT family N-acetyltransferase [Streptomyces sp. NPDC049040]|uniref:GNAT family N-acetyltransferase n=1 Tax=Streptomyces sp. NPDC049040 TaxID=3365593 RepID=UPI0037218495